MRILKITAMMFAIIFLWSPASDVAAVDKGKKAALSDIAWMTGHWEGKALGGEVEEHWSRGAGGSMVGMFRLVKDGKTTVLEYLIIAEEEGEIVYRFKHFNSKMVPWEEKPLFYRLVELSDDKAVFLSPDTIPGKPRRLDYMRTGADSMTIRVGGMEEGSFMLPMKRAKSVP